MTNAETILIVLLAGLLVGLAKGGLGAMGALITPLVTLTIDPKHAVGLVLLMLIIGDWIALYVYWGKWEGGAPLVRRLPGILWHRRIPPLTDGGRMIRLLLGAVVGIIAGTALLNVLSGDALKKLIGVFTLFFAAYKLAEGRLSGMSYQSRNWHASLAGSLAGFASSLSNAGGPPFNAYMLLQQVSPVAFVATATLFFATVNLIKVPGFVLSDVLNLDLLRTALPGMILVPVGVWIGKKIIDVINRRLFEIIVLAGMVLSGVLLLTR